MLSRLSSLHFSSMKDIDDQDDVIIIRTDPLYKTAALVQSHTQHVLRLHIDSLSDHVRYFIKIPFINKCVDFIDLQSVLSNKNVMNCILKYFKNLEPPL